VSLGVAEWLFSILPFYLIDRWRSRRFHNGRTSDIEH
jgi:hypothetical protein